MQSYHGKEEAARRFLVKERQVPFVQGFLVISKNAMASERKESRRRGKLGSILRGIVPINGALKIVEITLRAIRENALTGPNQSIPFSILVLARIQLVGNARVAQLVRARR